MLVLYKKYKEMILYVVFGGLTTLVNIVVYGLMYDYAGFSNVISTVAAWILSVLFAYITNKLFVFESKTFTFEVLRAEIPSFFLCRLATGLMDLAIMYLFVDVDVLGLNGFQLSLNLGFYVLVIKYHMIVKIISNIIVIILNYVASKLIIFKRNENG